MEKTKKNDLSFCALCKKPFPFEKLQMIRSAELSVRAMALEALSGSKGSLMEEPECCKRHGVSVLSAFCPTCKALLEKELLEEELEKEKQ